MRILISTTIGFSAAFASAAEKPATVLEPTSQWVVDYADNNCRLIRMFGTDKGAIKLVFEQVAPRSPMTVMLVGKFRAASDNNILGFEPLADVGISGGQSLEAVASRDSVVFWPRRMGRGRWGLIPEALVARMRKADPVAAEASSSVPSDLSAPQVKWTDHDWSMEPEVQWQAEDAVFGTRADKVTALGLNLGRSGSVSLHTGGLAEPLRALEKCTSDSLKDWGVDPAVEATIATGAHPVRDGQSLFTSDDYPQAALQSFKEDNLDVWLNIDAQGRIAGCRAISDFATPEINDAICGMIQRKERFIPARTKGGTAVPDFYIQSFVFRMR
jgi:hypothetical protein